MATEFRSSIATGALTARQFLMLAAHACTRLKWENSILPDNKVVADSPMTLWSNGEKVTITVNGSEAEILSKCAQWQLTDRGRNKKVVAMLIAKIEELRPQYTPQQLDEAMDALEAAADASVEAFRERYESGTLTSTDKVAFGIGGYYVTYSIIALNVLVFIVMAISGVHIMEPTFEDILNSGGNIRAYTAGGQWWRLITSCFVHVGIIHLLLNMYALFFAGIFLEPIMGRWRFLSVYLATGVLAGVTTLWWSADRLSAGASGAIFGMYGFFLALLLTNTIEKQLRKPLLLSVAVFIIFNLVYGMKPGIDNAAHVGGLISGVVFGYMYSRFNKTAQLKELFTFMPAVIALIVSLQAINMFADDTIKFERVWNRFAELEKQAMEPLINRDSLSAGDFIQQAETISVPAWKQIQMLLAGAENYNLQPGEALERRLLVQYTGLRLEHTKAWIKTEKENSTLYLPRMDSLNKEIDAVITLLKHAQSK